MGSDAAIGAAGTDGAIGVAGTVGGYGRGRRIGAAGTDGGYGRGDRRVRTGAVGVAGMDKYTRQGLVQYGYAERLVRRGREKQVERRGGRSGRGRAERRGAA